MNFDEQVHSIEFDVRVEVKASGWVFRDSIRI